MAPADGTELAWKPRMTTSNPRPNVLAVLALTMACCSSTGCTNETTLDGYEAPTPLGEVEQAFTSDPSINKPYGQPCRDKHNYQGHPVRVYFRCSSSEPGPLVLVLRAYGTAYDFKKYNYLLQFLARNGYTAASIDYLGPAGGSQAGAAAFLRGFLENDLLGSWPRAHTIDPSKLALVGHSRGGYTARALAEDLASDNNPWNVRALVNLAAAGPGNNMPSGATTDAFLILQGTHDGDIKPTNSFEHFDTSGAAPAAFVSMKLIQGARHDAFVSDTSNSKPVTPLARTTRGYVLAFLDAHVRGNSSWYDDYIRGDQVPNNNTLPLKVVAGQYRDAFTYSIDTFEDGTVGTNDLGGSVFRSAGIDHQSVTALHFTQALSALALNSTDHITWRIPSGSGPVSHLRKLSLRIGQSSGVPSNDLTMQIRNNGVWSQEVRLSDWGTIAQPMEMCTKYGTTQTTCGQAELTFEAHMRTILIPTTEFGATNDVERVRLRFRGDATHKLFYIDDLAFAEEASWP